MKIVLENIAVNFIERGPKQGVPVVFIHGFPFSHEMWMPQLNALPDTIRSIAYDVRGHGGSDASDGQYTIDMFVDDLIALLDHLDIRSAVLCGLSMGGYIALRAVERNPERIRGLVLCNTKSDPDTNEGKINRSATIKRVKTSGVQAFAADFVGTIFSRATHESHPDLVRAIRRTIEKNSPLGICGTLLALAARTDTSRVLPSIKVPTCVIAGEVDTIIPPAVMKAMHERIDASEFHVLHGAAHMSNLECPAEFNGLLIEFLRHGKP